MYYYLVSSLKRRLIEELKDSFKDHPIYEKVVPYIQNKYGFPERPQYGIVVKGSSANKVQLSGDNYMGVIEGHAMLAYAGNKPAYPLEWIREDQNAVRASGDHFPTQPGIYYMEILAVPTNATTPGLFIIDPLVTVSDEPVLMFRSGIEHEAQLQGVPVRGTLRLWENGRVLFEEGTDYTINWMTGALNILTRSGPGSTLVADYRVAAPSSEPTQFSWNVSDSKTIPGVVLAFGKRAKVGDKVAIVIYKDRVDTANAYGGKFEVTFELDVIARDPNQMEEMADLVIMYLWGHKKPALEFEGIEIIDISMGGETEEIYDETTEEPYFNASISIQLRADWEIHLPLPLTISKATAENPTTKESDIVGGLNNSLFFATAPVLPGRNSNYEKIG